MRSSTQPSFASCALVAALALAACRDKPEPPPEPPPPPPVSGLAAVPADATAVVGIDVRAFARAEAAREIIARVQEREPELARRVHAVLSACAIDPARDLEQVLLAAGDSPTQALLVVDGALDATRFPDCVGQAVAPSGGSVVGGGDSARPVWTTRRADGSAAVWFALGAPRTLVVAISDAWLAAALADGAKLATDERAQAVLQRADRQAAAWLFGRVDAQLAARFAALAGAAGAAKIDYVFGSLLLSDGVDIELGAVLPSAADAAATAEFARGQVEPLALVAQGVGLGGLVSRVRVEVEKDTVFLRLTLSAEELKETLSQIDRAAGGE